MTSKRIVAVLLAFPAANFLWKMSRKPVGRSLGRRPDETDDAHRGVARIMADRAAPGVCGGSFCCGETANARASLSSLRLRHPRVTRIRPLSRVRRAAGANNLLAAATACTSAVFRGRRLSKRAQRWQS